MRKTIVALLPLLLDLTAAAPAAAAGEGHDASAAARSMCRNAFGGDVIAATNMGCAKAREVVRTWAVRYKRDGRYDRTVHGFACRITPDEIEGDVGRCTSGRKSVRFYPNVPR